MCDEIAPCCYYCGHPTPYLDFKRRVLAGEDRSAVLRSIDRECCRLHVMVYPDVMRQRLIYNSRIPPNRETTKGSALRGAER